VKKDGLSDLERVDEEEYFEKKSQSWVKNVKSHSNSKEEEKTLLKLPQ